MEIVLGILAIMLILAVIALGISILAACLGIGAVVGVFPPFYYAIKNSFDSIKRNITNKFMKVIMYICLFTIALALVGILAFLVTSIFIDVF